MHKHLLVSLEKELAFSQDSSLSGAKKISEFQEYFRNTLKNVI